MQSFVTDTNFVYSADGAIKFINTLHQGDKILDANGNETVINRLEQQEFSQIYEVFYTNSLQPLYCSENTLAASLSKVDEVLLLRWTSILSNPTYLYVIDPVFNNELKTFIPSKTWAIIFSFLLKSNLVNNILELFLEKKDLDIIVPQLEKIGAPYSIHRPTEMFKLNIKDEQLIKTFQEFNNEIPKKYWVPDYDYVKAFQDILFPDEYTPKTLESFQFFEWVCKCLGLTFLPTSISSHGTLTPLKIIGSQTESFIKKIIHIKRYDLKNPVLLTRIVTDSSAGIFVNGISVK